jgi:hypothetical protein
MHTKTLDSHKLRQTIPAVMIILLLLISFTASSQFEGGSGDGHSSLTAVSVSLSATNTAYSGGTDDGFNSASVSLLPLSASNTMYSGGTDDGFSINTALNLSFNTTSMYSGGANDGFSLFAVNALAFNTTTMFAGGVDDGFNSILTPALPLSSVNTPYSGGADDGFSFGLATALPLNSSGMFSGGSNDGFSSIVSPGLPFSSPGMYAGGINDGYSTVQALGLLLILPVTFEDFTVARNGVDAVLNWKVSSEQNVGYYAIERSFNGSGFEYIKRVNARGGTGVLDYRYTDSNPVAQCSGADCSQVYYRIRSVDKDGSYSFSMVKRVLFEMAKASVKVFPNPASDKLMISFNLPNGRPFNYSLFLYNNLGVCVWSKTGVSDITYGLNTSQLASGIYYLKLSEGSNTYQSQITIIH